MTQVIKLSDNAASRIKEIMSSADNATIGVRVGVQTGGCAGMSYIMEYAKDIKPNEEVIEDKGVKVLIDPNAIMYLLGTEMDYKRENFSSQFVFKNEIKYFLLTVVHLKLNRMRSMLKLIDFLKL
jgi:iron-sulfur cluster assembly protein